MKQSMFKRGFKAVKEEEVKREQLRKERQGKLWRVYFPKEAEGDEEYEIPFMFLTDEPICFYEHTLNINGKVIHRTCRGEGCKDCANGNKPRFVGGFLGIDRTPFEVEERDKGGNKTGKKRTVEASVKLLVRGQTDLAQLDRLNNKYGLVGRAWGISKTGKDTSTKWMFDRGELEELSEKEIQALLPETLRKKDYFDIVEEQVSPSEDEEEVYEKDNESDDDLKSRVTSGVQNMEDEEEEDTPRRAPRSSKTRGSKSSSTHHKKVIRRK